MGTEDGLLAVELDPPGQARVVAHTLAGEAVRGIAVHPDNPLDLYVACGLRGHGLHRSKDGGQSFACVGFADRWVWDVAFQAGRPDVLWAGTEPPMLYRSYDQAQSFEPLPGVVQLPSRNRWRFFHPPYYAGHVHGIATTAARPERLWAGVEHGALIYTHDAGATWHEALVGYDLHRIAVDPHNPDRLLAGAGEGLFCSTDGGERWEAIPDLLGKYIHGLCFDPCGSDRAFAYADVAGAPLYRSEDRGRTWKPMGVGLPAAAPADPLVAHPTRPGVLLYAGDAAAGRSRLYLSLDAGERWAELDITLPKVWRLKSE